MRDANLMTVSVLIIIFCVGYSKGHINSYERLNFANFVNLTDPNFESVENLPAYFEDEITWPNITDLLCGNFAEKNISTQCLSQMEIVCSNPGLLLPMVDAWSKFPYTGMTVATKKELGTYDQCLSIEHEQDGTRVLGKHCAYGLIIPTTSIPSQILSTAYQLSYCAPNACSSRDVFRLLGFLPDEQLINEVLCSTKDDDSKMDGQAIAILTVFCFLFGIIAVSTLYDVVLYANQDKNKYPLFTAFSFFTNARKLFTTTPISTSDMEQIMVFHGLKLISMLWIVAGHFATGMAFLPAVNDSKVTNFLNERYSQYLSTAHLAVDTFFFISGFLMAYQYFKKEAYKPIIAQVKTIPLLIFQRYLRLTPALLMFYLYLIGLNKYSIDGALRNLEKNLRQPCLDNWYAVFLYIQNYHNKDNLCMTNLWYVSADMQLFLVAPIVMIPIAFIVRKNLFRTALKILIMANLIFMVIPIFTKLMFREYDPDYAEFDSHSRLIDYFIGFTCGFYIRHRRDKLFIFDSWMNVFLWILTLGSMLGVVLVLQEININHGYVAKALCYSFMRPVWCLGLCWIVYSCVHGKGGVINSILSNGFMQIGGRLTYSMYLVHSTIIMQWTLGARTSRYFNDLEMFYLTCGVFVMTWVVATIWSLAFESPTITITKVLMGGAGRKPRAPKANGYSHSPEKNGIPPPPPPPLRS